jgi:Bacterial regulatory protein, Fis family
MALNRFGCTLAEVEREHILETLACCYGNRTRAAKVLGISVRCLRMKLCYFEQSGVTVPPRDLNRSRGSSGYGHSHENFVCEHSV